MINGNNYAFIGPYDLYQDTTGRNSKYEMTIVATVLNNALGAPPNDLYQFSIDPEVDIDNS